MGERTPHLDPDCRGVFFGLSAIHNKAALIRSVLEGVTFSLRDCYEVLKEMGVSVSDMRACGGGGKSRVWRQMMADVYGCPVKTVLNNEGAALGVAILAGVGAGIFSSVEAGCDAVIHTNEPQNPKAENCAEYEKFYTLYKTLYPALKDKYKILAGI
jgi:xylulokinase